MQTEVYKEDYRGYVIEIDQDLYPINPFEEYDGNAPIAVLSYECGRAYVKEYATQYGNVSEMPELTREQIKANLPEIMEMLEVKSLFALRDSSYEANLQPIINDRLKEAAGDLSATDELEAICKVWNMAGIPALYESRSGYNQGDYISVLAVATPEFQKECGNAPGYWTEKGMANLKSQIDLYAQWCFGDCYIYTVLDQDGETIDGCGGFYGDYDAKEYGALSEARGRIDWQCEQDLKNRVSQVKAWIRNRVPLLYRHFAV